MCVFFRQHTTQKRCHFKIPNLMIQLLSVYLSSMYLWLVTCLIPTLTNLWVALRSVFIAIYPYKTNCNCQIKDILITCSTWLDIFSQGRLDSIHIHPSKTRAVSFGTSIVVSTGVFFFVFGMMHYLVTPDIAQLKCKPHHQTIQPLLFFLKIMNDYKIIHIQQNIYISSRCCPE